MFLCASICVNVVFPGWIETKLFAELHAPKLYQGKTYRCLWLRLRLRLQLQLTNFDFDSDSGHCVSVTTQFLGRLSIWKVFNLKRMFRPFIPQLTENHYTLYEWAFGIMVISVCLCVCFFFPLKIKMHSVSVAILYVCWHRCGAIRFAAWTFHVCEFPCVVLLEHRLFWPKRDESPYRLRITSTEDELVSEWKWS